MPKMIFKNSTFIWMGTFDERTIADKVGFIWDDRIKKWKTKDLTKALKLSKYADESAKKFLDKFKKTLKESHATDFSFKVPAPEGLRYLNFQRAGIKFAVTRKVTFIADEMGLGKTIETIGVFNFLGVVSALILCPTTACENWQNKLNDWHVLNPTIEIVRSGKQKLSNADIIICPFSLTYKSEIVQQLSMRRFEYNIIDEVHNLKNPISKRTLAIFGATKEQTGDGCLSGLCKKHILLSGTPIDNRPIEFFPVLKSLAPEVINYMGYWAYAKKYCSAYDTGYGWNVKGASNQDELQARLRSTIMIRRLKKDVLKELPPKIYKDHYLPTTGKTKQLLKLEKELENANMGELAAIRKKLGLLKITAGIDFIKDLMESGTNKLVIFAHHCEVIEQLKKRLFTYGVVSITGSTPAKNRQPIADIFQNDNLTRIFIGNILAAGEAISLTAANVVVFFEYDWRPGKMDQASDRPHRIGQLLPVYVINLLFKNSMDDLKMQKTLTVKRRNIYKVLDKPLEV